MVSELRRPTLDAPARLTAGSNVSPPHDSVEHQNAMVMAPSLGWRFSGINATMEALLPSMRKSVPIACCGKNLSKRMPSVSLLRWLTAGRRRHWRIWHARRNNDMLVGLFLKHVLRQKLILVWTSAAQRYHTGLTRFCYHRMDAVVATTQKAADFLTCQAEVSHHGVDSERFSPPMNRATAKRALGIADRPTLGVFGRVRPQKGSGDLVDALVHVLPRFPEWQVLFVGQVTPEFTSYANELKSKLAAAGLQDRVRFIGFLEDFDDLPQWYQAVDAVACVSRNEGFGVTCLEAMASSVPVVATDAGAWPEIVESGSNGWLVEAANSRSLAEGLECLFDCDAAELAELGKRARETIVNRFTIKHEIDRLIRLYNQLFQQVGQTDWAAKAPAEQPHRDSRMAA